MDGDAETYDACGPVGHSIALADAEAELFAIVACEQGQVRAALHMLCFQRLRCNEIPRLS